MRLRNWPRWQRWLNRRIPPASSVELNQRRVFILPTRQGGAFGLALLVMLLAAINYQNSLAYGLTFLLLSLGVVTILHTYRNLAGLRLTALGADPVFAGERAGFRVRLKACGGRARPSPSAGRSGRWNTPTWQATRLPRCCCSTRPSDAAGCGRGACGWRVAFPSACWWPGAG